MLLSCFKGCFCWAKTRDIIDVSVIEHLWVVTIHCEFHLYIIRIKILIDYTLICHWSNICTYSVWGKGISHMDNRSVWSHHALIVSIWGHRPPPPHVVIDEARGCSAMFQLHAVCGCVQKVWKDKNSARSSLIQCRFYFKMSQWPLPVDLASMIIAWMMAFLKSFTPSTFFYSTDSRRVFLKIQPTPSIQFLQDGSKFSLSLKTQPPKKPKK